jgi:predicted short-subunit dehydrogenase-like oxidoreductase (DUF2520 family)
MIKVSIIGSGNVGQHLIKAFSESRSAELVQVYSRNPGSIANLISHEKIVDDYHALNDADLYIIAVSDDAVATVSQKLPFEGKLVAHTAGSLSLNVLDAKNRKACFYPLQTFTKNNPLDFSVVPLCIESEGETDFAVLNNAAKAISKVVHRIDTDQRQALHLAAVFVSNFSNHMYSIGEKLCSDNAMPFDILKPLIEETARKATVLSPAIAQTGPAVRHDQSTIDKHLSALKDQNLRNIYEMITKSISEWQPIKN